MQNIKRTGADRVHGAGLKIHEDGAGDVAAAGGLVVVHVDALELEVRVAVVGAGGVHTMLVGDNLPELGTDLVAALASLKVNNLSHGDKEGTATDKTDRVVEIKISMVDLLLESLIYKLSYRYHGL